ncbi:MAG: hypothetical protein J07HQX50_01619 [Haloquadratum sp. J07HQX50]|nr:MAG: hypothetical protein J07HQX50_01619 [Haloquadratum sp. J07HQX50]
MKKDNSADLGEWIDSPTLEEGKETYLTLSRWIERHTNASVHWNEAALNAQNGRFNRARFN